MLARVAQRNWADTWDAPPVALFDALVSQLDLITASDHSLNSVLSWSNLWHEEGLIGLNSRNFRLLQQFRGHMLDSTIGDYELITVPKAAITGSSSEVSTMLRGI